MSNEIEKWLESNEKEMISFLEDYIRYRSPTGQEEDVQLELIKPFFQDQMDWDEVEVIDVSQDNNRPNINAYLSGSGGGQNLLFNGHSDIVDVGEERRQRWTRSPFDPTIEDNRLYGRGANDMKGPNTAMIWAVKAVMESEIELQGDLMMSIVVGEELSEQELGSIPATNAHLERTDSPPFCVNGEPTYNEIHTKSAGTFHFTISIPGNEAHTSQKNLIQYPQRYGIEQGKRVGVDASRIMVDIMQALWDLDHQWNMRYRDEVFGSGGYPIPNDKQGVGAMGIVFSLLEAGEYIGSIPGHAEIEGQVYYPPTVDDAELWEEMKEVVESVSLSNDWMKENPPVMRWKEEFDWPPFSVPVDHPGVETLGDSVEGVMGDQPVFSGFKAVCDNAQIQRECGVDAISFGPGDISMGAHGPDEYIPLDQFMEAAKVYASMIVNWCNQER